MFLCVPPRPACCVARLGDGMGTVGDSTGGNNVQKDFPRGAHVKFLVGMDSVVSMVRKMPLSSGFS